MRGERVLFEVLPDEGTDNHNLESRGVRGINRGLRQNVTNLAPAKRGWNLSVNENEGRQGPLVG